MDAREGGPETLRGASGHYKAKPPQSSYTPWHLLERLHIAQWDILEFMRNPGHVSPRWPEGYWPAEDAQADEALWEQTLASFRADLQALQQFVTDPAVDLYAPIPHGSGQSVLREILLVTDHTTFHLGGFGMLRQVMQTWRNHEQYWTVLLCRLTLSLALSRTSRQRNLSRSNKG